MKSDLSHAGTAYCVVAWWMDGLFDMQMNGTNCAGSQSMLERGAGIKRRWTMESASNTSEYKSGNENRNERVCHPSQMSVLGPRLCVCVCVGAWVLPVVCGVPSLTLCVQCWVVGVMQVGEGGVSKWSSETLLGFVRVQYRRGRQPRTVLNSA